MAANETESVPTDRLAFWRSKWESNKIGFHNKDFHHLLLKHFDLLCKDGKKPERIFVPLCGKTLDMEWFGKQGVSVVGLDGVQTALEQFYTEHDLEWQKAPVPALGAQGTLLSSNDGTYQLYCGDIFDFSASVGGTFDAVWERGSLSALNRVDIKKYVKIIKELLKPGGRILAEVVEYDVAIFNDVNRPSKPPPPFPMYETDLKELYEPECSVKFLERDNSDLMGKQIHMAMYLITKQDQ